LAKAVQSVNRRHNQASGADRRPLRIEATVRGQLPYIRRAARQEQSKPQLADLKARMEAIRATLSAKSALAVALHYALKRWQALTRYLDHGRLEIDNLIAERAIRGIAIGRHY
jgi:transposase